MSSKHTHPRRGGLLATAAAAVLLIAGGATTAFAVWGNQPPPQPPQSATSPVAGSSTPARSDDKTPTPAATHKPDPIVGPVLDSSPPAHISIPAIGVDSSLMTLGLNDDGTVQVPPLGADEPAGWYTGSPTPGALGPAVILGHVDSYDGRSVFYRLGDTRPGDQISVARSDGTVAVFTVEKVGEYPKDDFPTLAVYGNTDRAELRLLTCGGVYNKAIGHYNNNIVVYAYLSSSHPA